MIWGLTYGGYLPLELLFFTKSSNFRLFYNKNLYYIGYNVQQN